ncbi:MAG: aminotransferase class I/II-fold pyridoxal phosphate-dependent enzyme [Chitinophagaceae bacterium]|nr:MAG: aminotransferase class I/II-fold pyridoxal phosphate-dependent enzyme [Chitinophagaceae bacterium]
MSAINRRNFLKTSGITVLPALIPALPAMAGTVLPTATPPDGPAVRFYGDGEMFTPSDYIGHLQKIMAQKEIARDFYGQGGAVAELEKKFQEITGKEKAVFMPSGTMSNQLALAVLSGQNTKVFVQETSHVYRDEADAAQSVHQKRLMPLAKGETYFTQEQLQQAIEALADNEVFASGVGAVSVENPVRRADGRIVPIEEIKKISAYCKSNNIPLHLDGARIHIASAWSGISVKEYASYFDTVYISLYKYLGAESGAILCGEKKVMDKMTHLVKVHGGSMFGNWSNAAMALYRLEGTEARLKQAIQQSAGLFDSINRIAGLKVSPLPGGSNIYSLQLDKNIEGKKFQAFLNTEYKMVIPRPDAANRSLISVNETMLYRDSAYITEGFRKAALAAKQA